MNLLIAGSRTVRPTLEDIDRAAFRLLASLPSGNGDLAAENERLRRENARLRAELDALRPPTIDTADLAEITKVIEGGADGADRAGREWAIRRKIDYETVAITKEDMQHGKYIGPRMRNRRMANIADVAAIFWDGVSGGTSDMCTRMVFRHKPVEPVPMRPFKRSSDR